MNNKFLSVFKSYYSAKLEQYGFYTNNIVEKNYTSNLGEVLLLQIENVNSDLLCVEFISNQYSKYKNSYRIFFIFQDSTLSPDDKNIRVNHYSTAIFGFDFDNIHQLLLSYFRAGLEKKIFVCTDPLILNNIPSSFIVDHSDSTSYLASKHNIILKGLEYNPLLRGIIKNNKPTVSLKIVFNFDNGFGQATVATFKYIKKHNYNIISANDIDKKETAKIIHFNNEFTRLSFLQAECEMVIQQQLDDLLNNNVVDLTMISQIDFDNIVLTKRMADY